MSPYPFSAIMCVCKPLPLCACIFFKPRMIFYLHSHRSPGPCLGLYIPPWKATLSSLEKTYGESPLFLLYFGHSAGTRLLHLFQLRACSSPFNNVDPETERVLYFEIKPNSAHCTQPCKNAGMNAWVQFWLTCHLGVHESGSPRSSHKYSFQVFLS